MDIREMEQEKIRQEALYHQEGLGKATPDTAQVQYEALQPCQPPLRERIRMQADRARRESRKADRLDELSYLLEKNPDVARILDLMEDARYY